jgi:hypothetical protein
VHTHRRRQAEKAMIETRRAQAAGARAGATGRAAAAGGGAAAAGAAAATGTAKTSAMAARLQQSGTGRVVLGASKVAVTGAKVAFASTVGAPVYAPRAAAAATARVVKLKDRLQDATERRVDEVGSFAREYGRNAAAPARWARRFVMADEVAASKAAATAAGAGRRRSEGQPAGGEGGARPRGWQSWDRKRQWEQAGPGPATRRADEPRGAPPRSAEQPTATTARGPRRNPDRAGAVRARAMTGAGAPGARREDLERRLARARGGGAKEPAPRPPGSSE